MEDHSVTSVVNNWSDEQLISLIMAGHSELFAEIVRRHTGRLNRIALAVLRNEADAEDVVQETYASAYLHLYQFEGRSKFVTWLMRIAHYRALAKATSRSRDPGVSTDEERVCSTLVHDGKSPEQSVWEHERAAILATAIRGLPESYREVLVLRELEEQDTLVVARRLRLTGSNVKVRLHRARHMLQQSLTRSILGRNDAGKTLSHSAWKRLPIAQPTRVGLKGGISLA